ncbi:heterokaryon incompatibility protein-domain-containing protein [Rhexocercosporidium sp. MPI-PUGE-AT-0058]|nr:heterokaryon incompatibility protein-domain-containing protein [Rhexocercosporidium sp. MPI-PUGE-AT-0058]
MDNIPKRQLATSLKRQYLISEASHKPTASTRFAEPSTEIPDDFHRCKHCQRVTIKPPFAASEKAYKFRVNLPHTRKEAAQAARDNCPLFEIFASSPPDDTKACSRRQLVRQVFSDTELFWYHRSCNTVRERLLYLYQSMCRRPFIMLVDEIDFGVSLFNFGWASDWQGMVSARADDVATVYAPWPIIRNSIAGSAMAYSTIQEWLKECNISHRSNGSCQQRTTSFTPTRLIEVGSKNNTYSPKLVLNPKIPTSWCCLSYCWGGDQPVKTTTATIESHTSSIVFADLPKSLQDALIVTAKIGMQYIWIDCLCIIQDDPEDLAKELSTMSSIYKYADITISASSAHGVSNGFLQERTWRPISTPFALSLQTPDSQTGTVQITDYNSYDFQSQDPVHSRAWIFQEQLLSSRVVDFSSMMVRWHCATISRNDAGWPEPEPEVGDSLMSMFSALNIMNRQSQRGEESSPEYFWSWIVQEFSKRNLSFAGDKLLAVSAIAQEMGERRGDQYMAGMWQSSLLETLLWMREAKLPVKRPERYRAPSWSWASIEGEIDFPGRYAADDDDGRHSRLVIELVTCHTQLENSVAPYGAVRSGILKLKGKLRQATWYYDAEELVLHDSYRDEIAGTTRKDAFESGWADNVADRSQEIWCLEVYESAGIYASRGLLLTEVSTEPAPAEEGYYFSRVGYFKLFLRKRSIFQDIKQSTLTIV